MECSKYCAQKMNAILRYKCTIGSNVMKRYVALYARLFFLECTQSQGTFTCVLMGKFLKIPLHVTWFIRLGRECGKSGNFARVP